MKERINKFYRSSVKQAEKLLQDDSKVSVILDESIDKMNAVTDRIADFQDKLMALYRLLRSWIKRDYTDVSTKTIVASIAALIYFINPLDIIPDFIPLTGFIDDAAVVAYVFSLISTEIDQFEAWEKGNSIEEVVIDS